jgi:hypothetical protein
MSRKIHAFVINNEMAAAVVETASSGGGRWGSPVRLTTIRFRASDIECLLAPRILGHAQVEQIEGWVVNGANRGPRSKFGRTLAAMKEELAQHVGAEIGAVLYFESALSPESVKQLAAHALGAVLPEATSTQRLRF